MMPLGVSEKFFRPLMQQLGYDPSETSTDISTPRGVGNVACEAVLDFRHHDSSNQLGDMNPSRIPLFRLRWLPAGKPSVGCAARSGWRC
jgi:hypothetical protein